MTLWLRELRTADEEAAQKLWIHFVSRLCALGRKRLSPETRRVYDEDDAALSAFHSVCVGIRAGRFPDLQDRDSLWSVLAVVTARKISRRHRYDRQERRDVRRNVSESIFQSGGNPASDGLVAIKSCQPTAEYAAEFVETCEQLFASLADPTLEQVAALRIAGHTDSEIADQVKCSRRTVQRRLEVIRRQWESQGAVE